MDSRRLTLKRAFQTLFILSILSSTVSAQLDTLIGGMCQLADALGLLIISLMGARWMVADSAQERAEAKKGIIYVVVGLLVVHSMGRLIDGLYIAPAASAGIPIPSPVIPAGC
jgi:hypothetical protein